MSSVRHGGRVLALAREQNLDYRDILDFSANINPLGPSPEVLRALRESLELVRVYPEERANRLSASLSEELQVPVESILVGNGATELLYFWLRTVRARTATLIVPTFTEYRRALEGSAVEIRSITLKPEDLFRLPTIQGDSDVVIVTNPNNPTGACERPEVIEEWIEHFPNSTQILLDEAFIEFAAQPSLAPKVERFPNLWVLRSMTKFYAIPGLRLGYLLGQAVPSIARFREPWQVNNLAELAGIVSLKDTAHKETTLQLVQTERIWLWSQLQRLQHVRAFPSAANFFFACCDTHARLDELIGRLAKERILIRDCRDVEGLDGPYFRFAIKSRSDNTRLMDHLRSI